MEPPPEPAPKPLGSSPVRCRMLPDGAYVRAVDLQTYFSGLLEIIQQRPHVNPDTQAGAVTMLRIVLRRMQQSIDQTATREFGDVFPPLTIQPVGEAVTKLYFTSEPIISLRVQVLPSPSGGPPVGKLLVNNKEVHRQPMSPATGNEFDMTAIVTEMRDSLLKSCFAVSPN